MKVPLSKGLFALVSPVDFLRVSRYKWHANQSNRGTFYVRGWVPVWECEWTHKAPLSGSGRYRHVLLHRFIMKVPDEIRCDHKNRDRLDCRRENLRVATQSLNLMNRRGFSATGYKGVYKDNRGIRRNPYSSSIRHNGKTIRIGYFATLKAAVLAYKIKAVELRGYDEVARDVGWKGA